MRKTIESMAAVVIRMPPECLSATIAPHSSTKRRITPPCSVPKKLAWPGWVMIARLIREAEAGFGPGV